MKVDVSVESGAHDLMASLAMSVPGDLGTRIRAIVGVRSESVGSDEELCSESFKRLAQVHPVDSDGDLNYMPGSNIMPPGAPIRWASNLLALCCRVYGQPLERAVPVGACLELLGITAASLDAAQDYHHTLLEAYNACPDSVGIPEEGSRSTHLIKRHSSYIEHNEKRSAALVSNASVAIIGLAWRALLEHGPRYGIESPTVLEIGQLIAEMLVRACEAQHLDLTVGRTPVLSLEEYEQVLEGKTGQIDGTACEVGAVLAHAEHHRNFWRTLGTERAIAQQLYDDYIDFTDDILNGGQVGHSVLYGLAVADPAQKENISSLLAQARSNTPDAKEALSNLSALLRELGAEYYTLASLVMHRNRSLVALEEMKLPSEYHELLYEWIMSAVPKVG